MESFRVWAEGQFVEMMGFAEGMLDMFTSIQEDEELRVYLLDVLGDNPKANTIQITTPSKLS